MSIPWDTMGPDLSDLVRREGRTLVEAEIVSPLLPVRPRRVAFRLRFSDGSVMKGRRLQTEEQAREAWRIARLLSSARVARPIAVSGDALIEEWLPGEPIGSGLEEIFEAGRMLAEIHRAGPAGPARRERVGRSWVDASLDVEPLIRAGLLDRRIGEQAVGMARSALPPHAEWGVCHGDFCAENLLRVTGRGLFVIDNETLGEGWYDFDLARTWYRWPMAPAGFRTFLNGYALRRDVGSYLRAMPFWNVAALVRAARFRLEDGSPTGAPIARLVAIARGVRPLSEEHVP